MTQSVRLGLGIPIHRSAKAAENGRILRIQYHLCFHTYRLSLRVSEGRYQKRNVVKRLTTVQDYEIQNGKSPGDARPGVEDAAMEGDPPCPPFRPHPAPRHPRVSLVHCSVTDLKMFNMKSKTTRRSRPLSFSTQFQKPVAGFNTKRICLI